MGILLHENPDLSVKINGLSRKATELYGMSIAKLLKDRGILAGSAQSVSEVSDEQIEAVLQELASVYRDASPRPASMKALVYLHPEHKAVLDAFSIRCTMVYGTTPRKKLIELGICEQCKADKVSFSREDAEQAIDELGKMLCDVPSEGKPDALPKLASEYPELAEMLRGNDKKDFASKEHLQLLGILATNKTQIKKRGIRREPLEELLPEFGVVTPTRLFEPGKKEAGLLPSHLKGLDLDNGVELRCATIALVDGAAQSLNAGDRFDIHLAVETDRYGEERKTISIECEPRHSFTPRNSAGVYDGWVEQPQSALSEYVGATVVSKSTYGDKTLVQLELCYLAEIDRDTLAYVLRELGIVRESDLRGEMEGFRPTLVRLLATTAQPRRRLLPRSHRMVKRARVNLCRRFLGRRARRRSRAASEKSKSGKNRPTGAMLRNRHKRHLPRARVLQVQPRLAAMSPFLSSLPTML